MNAQLQELQSIWHSEIPISKVMGINAVSFVNDQLTVRAPLQPNINVHGTAFAGSLYAVCALCGWGMTWLQLKQHNLNGSIVIADGHIRYHRPIAEDIVVTCDFSAHTDALIQLQNHGKTRFSLQCEIYLDSGKAAEFEGIYAIKA